MLKNEHAAAEGNWWKDGGMMMKSIIDPHSRPQPTLGFCRGGSYLPPLPHVPARSSVNRQTGGNRPTAPTNPTSFRRSFALGFLRAARIYLRMISRFRANVWPTQKFRYGRGTRTSICWRKCMRVLSPAISHGNGEESSRFQKGFHLRFHHQ